MFCSSVCFYIFNMVLYLLFFTFIRFLETLRLVFFIWKDLVQCISGYIFHFLILSWYSLSWYYPSKFRGISNGCKEPEKVFYNSSVLVWLWCHLTLGARVLFLFSQLNDTVFLKSQNRRCICIFDLYHYSFLFCRISLKFPALWIHKNFWDFKRNEKSIHISKVSKYVSVIPNNAIVDTFTDQEIYYFSKWACFIT